MASWLLAETHWKFSVCRGKPQEKDRDKRRKILWLDM